MYRDPGAGEAAEPVQAPRVSTAGSARSFPAPLSAGAGALPRSLPHSPARSVIPGQALWEPRPPGRSTQHRPRAGSPRLRGPACPLPGAAERSALLQTGASPLHKYRLSKCSKSRRAAFLSPGDISPPLLPAPFSPGPCRQLSRSAVIYSEPRLI